MVFHHRNFVSYLINDTATDSCASYCNSSDTSSFCLPPCLTYCPSCCDEFMQSFIPSPSPVHHKTPRFLIIIATILATIFFVLLCFVIFVKFYFAPRRRSSSQPPRIINQTLDDFVDEDHGPVVDHPIWYINTVGLQPSIISEITVLKYKKGDGLVEGTDCSVCLSEFQDDETLRLLPKCNHAFHVSCIDTWLRSHTNCPLCRAPIVKNNRVDRSSSSSSSSPPPAAPPPNNENLSTRGGSTQVNILVQNNGGRRREFEDEVCERRNNNHNERDQEMGDLEIEQRRKRNDQESDDEIQPIRRSVSLDSVSASKLIQGLSDSVSQEVRINSDTHFAEEGSLSQKIVPKKVGRSESLLRFVGSSSIIGRSLQNAPVSLKRSFSCSGKFLLSRSR